MRCDKCLTCLHEDNFIKYAIHVEDKFMKINLCFNCDMVYDNRTEMLKEFLKEDYGTFPINNISKNMIESRKKRSLQESPWDQMREEKSFN